MDVLLSTIANNFPLYFRAPTLMTLTWIFWGINVSVYRKFNIDYPELLNFNRSTLLSPKQIIWSGISMLLVFVALCVMYAYQWPFEDVMILPSILYVVCLFLFLAPAEILHKSGRERLLHNIFRVFVPSKTGVLFVEVVLGDILTSIAKVLADLEVTGCVLLAHMTSPTRGTHDHTNTANMDSQGSISKSSFLLLYAHESGCADSWMRPFVTSLPFLLRFRQCLHQYFVTKEAFPNLLNCLKYLSSLPVIWISAYTHHYPGSEYAAQLRYAWILCVSFNSFFSFMWDVVMDWGFCRQGAKHFLLRENLIYGGTTQSIPPKRCISPVIYYIAIGMDFVLRILWSFKLSVHFQLSQEGVTFVLEVCEVFRRFIWLFFRVEWQSVSTSLNQKVDKVEMEELEPLNASEEDDKVKPIPWDVKPKLHLKNMPLRSRSLSDRNNSEPIGMGSHLNIVRPNIHPIIEK